MGIGEVLDASINMYFRNFGLLAKIAAVVAIPLFVIIFLLDQIAFAEPTASSFDDLGIAFVGEYRQTVDFSTFNLIAVVETLIAVIAYLMIVGAAFRAVSEIYVGRDTTAGSSLRFASGRVHSLLWMGFLLLLGVGLATLALVLPGIWLLIAWSLAAPALLAENLKGSKALGRSFDLVRNNWWRTFGALIVGFIFIALFEFLLGLAAEGLTSATEDSKNGSLLIVDALQALTLIITAPLQAAIITVIYYDLRVRKEGFDVQLLTEGLESPGSSNAPQPPPAPAAPAAASPGWSSSPASTTPPAPGGYSGEAGGPPPAPGPGEPPPRTGP